jgi:hypothetical protein
MGTEELKANLPKWPWNMGSEEGRQGYMDTVNLWLLSAERPWPLHPLLHSAAAPQGRQSPPLLERILHSPPAFLLKTDRRKCFHY